MSGASWETALMGALAGAAALLAVAVVLLGRAVLRQREALARQRELVDEAGKRSVRQSRAVILGQVGEQVAPLLPGFGYNPKDARFLGQPIDYVVFNGLNDPEAAGGSQAEPQVEVVLVEIKSGQSRLSPGEKAVRAAVEAGRVRFETLRLGEDGNLRAE